MDKDELAIQFSLWISYCGIPVSDEGAKYEGRHIGMNELLKIYKELNDIVA